MKEKRLIRLSWVLLTILLGLTLCPLILMCYTSFKPGGTLGRPVSNILVVESAWLRSGETLSFPLGQDMRKFSTLSFTIEREGGGTVTIGLMDIEGRRVTLSLDRYVNPGRSGRQKVAIPLSDFDLSALNPHVPEKTAEELVISLQDGKGRFLLQKVQLRFRKFTLINYIDVWVSGAFGQYLFNSTLIALCIVLGNLVFASMAGYVFARKQFPGKQILFLLILGSLMIPPQVFMVPIFILMKNLKWLNTYWALIIPALVSPLNIFLMRQYISQLPPSLEDAARMDGASDVQIFLKVVLPLARPALAVVGINTFMGSWNTFLYPFLLTNTTQMRTLPVGLALYKSLQGVDWVHLMAGSSITALPVIVVFLLFQRHIIAGLTAGSIKG